MALPYPWTTISVGDKVLYDDHLTDLRGNADWLDSNPGCSTVNISVNSGADATADATADTVPYCNVANGTINATPHNSSVNSTNYGSNNPTDNPSNNPGDYPSKGAMLTFSEIQKKESNVKSR